MEELITWLQENSRVSVKEMMIIGLLSKLDEEFIKETDDHILNLEGYINDVISRKINLSIGDGLVRNLESKGIKFAEGLNSEDIKIRTILEDIYLSLNSSLHPILAVEILNRLNSLEECDNIDRLYVILDGYNTTYDYDITYTSMIEDVEESLILSIKNKLTNRVKKMEISTDMELGIRGAEEIKLLKLIIEFANKPTTLYVDLINDNSISDLKHTAPGRLRTLRFILKDSIKYDGIADEVRYRSMILELVITHMLNGSSINDAIINISDIVVDSDNEEVTQNIISKVTSDILNEIYLNYKKRLVDLLAYYKG